MPITEVSTVKHARCAPGYCMLPGRCHRAGMTGGRDPGRSRWLLDVACTWASV